MWSAKDLKSVAKTGDSISEMTPCRVTKNILQLSNGTHRVTSVIFVFPGSGNGIIRFDTTVICWGVQSPFLLQFSIARSQQVRIA